MTTATTAKPAALKTDENGNCITICRTGQLEYIHKLITEDGLSQREASQSFIDAVNAHVTEGDPITIELTVEKVRSQFRRDSGKLKDKPNNGWVEPTQATKPPELTPQLAEHLLELVVNDGDHIPDTCRQCSDNPFQCIARKIFSNAAHYDQESGKIKLGDL